MTLKNYLILMSVMTTVCLGVLVSVLFTVDPFTTNWIGFVLFYTSLFLALSGIFSIFGFLGRFIIFRQALIFCLVADSFRQAVILSAALCGALFLLSQDLLNWINFSLLLLGAAILEYLLLSGSRARSYRRHLTAPEETVSENNNQ